MDKQDLISLYGVVTGLVLTQLQKVEDEELKRILLGVDLAGGVFGATFACQYLNNPSPIVSVLGAVFGCLILRKLLHRQFLIRHNTEAKQKNQENIINTQNLTRIW